MENVLPWKLNMDKSKIFGLWKEHFNDTFPSLLDAPRAKLSSRDMEMIAHYLEICPIWIASPGVVYSSTNTVEIAGTPSIRTDGQWAWQDTMAYYVRKLHITPPAEFVLSVQEKMGIPPLETDLNLELLEFPEL